MRKTLFVITAALLTQTALADPVLVTPADRGKTIALAVGQCVDVRLTTNPSTGYDWYLAPGLDEALSLGSRSMTGPANPMPGAPSQLDYMLCATRPGTVAVKLAYYRRWEKNTPPVETFDFTVKIAK